VIERQIREHVGVKIRIAEAQRGRRQILEVVADSQFRRDAHAAVQLHGLLADEARRAAHDQLRRRDHAAPLGRVCFADGGCGQMRHRQREFLLHEHVRQPVTQRLKASERLSELLARAQILGSHLDQAFHRPRAGCARRRDAQLQRRFEHRRAVRAIAEHRPLRHAHRLQRDFGGALAIERRIGAHGHTRRRCRHDEQRHGLNGRIPRRDDQRMRGPAVPYVHLVAVEYEAVILHARRGLRLRVVVAALWFLIRERDDLAALDHRRQPRLPLRVRAETLNQTSRHHCTGNQRLGKQRASGFELHGEGISGGAVEAAVVGRDRQPEYAEVRIGAPRIGAEAVGIAHRVAARVDRIAFLGEASQAVRELTLLFAI